MERLVSFIDYTSLDVCDNNESISILCENALKIKPASVCVFPIFTFLVSEKLMNSGIATTAVAAGFPTSQIPIQCKLNEVMYVLDNGANEIDVVLSVGMFLEGKYDLVKNEIIQIKNLRDQYSSTSDKKILKVILETGALKTEQNIRLAARLAIEAGADFIKTSTGKISVGATLEAFEFMLLEIKDHFLKTNKKVGVKVSGGISDWKTAKEYHQRLMEILGEGWDHPDFFRIGSSKLVADLI